MEKCLTELYPDWLDTGKFPVEGAEQWDNITEFTASGEALNFLLRYICDIRGEVPDEDGERKIIELWRDSSSWDEWSTHLDTIIHRLEEQML